MRKWFTYIVSVSLGCIVRVYFVFLHSPSTSLIQYSGSGGGTIPAIIVMRRTNVTSSEVEVVRIGSRRV